jgi:hypothetical protein
MKIKYDWFKDTGKWYEGGEKEIPDELFLFSKELILAINPDTNLWWNRADQGWFMVIDNIEMTAQQSLDGKFMKALWTPETIFNKLQEANN